ncbi:hypothetical protein [Tomitella gaofuii]|uniref:hypothetical protein n=1 Tax=Tomitella gaofuii TaxID=2760083 RepID=UPI0015FC117B|nr:hypothetical protein [Tomitella gaofuii]
MAFEVFDKRNTSLRRAPSVSIQKRGVISINRAAYTLMGTPECVELLYDRDDGVVGIRGVGDDVPHGYAVRGAGRSAGTGPVMVAGSAFTAFYDIDTMTSRRYPARLDDDNVLCVDLAEGTEIIGNRARRHVSPPANASGAAKEHDQ